MSGVLALITAFLNLLASAVGRASVSMFGGPAAVEQRLPLKLSLKSILKGWISLLIWSTIVFFIAGFVLAFLAHQRTSAQAPASEPSLL